MMSSTTKVVVVFLAAIVAGCGVETGKGVDWQARREQVKAAFVHGWDGYSKYAWGADELRPSSNSSHDWLHLGATIVSSLDSLLIMDLKEQYGKAVDWVHSSMKVDQDVEVSLFETTIRVLGGLLGAFDLSRDEALLRRAAEVADRLMPAFTSEQHGIPAKTVNLHSGKVGTDDISLAEVGSLQLEWRYLSYHLAEAGVPDAGKYQRAVDAAFDAIVAQQVPEDGLYPDDWNPASGESSDDHISFGGGGDSFYEYLLKQYLQNGQREPRFLDLFQRTLRGIRSRLLRKSRPSGYLYVDEYDHGLYTGRVEHLSCFLGATFALYDFQVADQRRSEWGEGIGRTCYQMYRQTATGVAPESIQFVTNKDFMVSNPHNYLRPETVETLMYLYWITGNETYREWGWDIFQAFEKYSRTPTGYSGLENVEENGADLLHDDLQQAFFFSETLKYLFLLFSEPGYKDIRLDTHVFNTEAHALTMFNKPLAQVLHNGATAGLPSSASASEAAAAVASAPSASSAAASGSSASASGSASGGSASASGGASAMGSMFATSDLGGPAPGAAPNQSQGSNDSSKDSSNDSGNDNNKNNNNNNTKNGGTGQPPQSQAQSQSQSLPPLYYNNNANNNALQPQ
eukprot:TRINITY_DN67993_c2_g1_i1.p2 TRINITY_DN67993_c2_g1~~TRINITY_DN67993_c2_g1_i1.p2  ORF type:complete len:627 (-),score=300.72 TRINITY_DN67993_c2_g1_i1:64-1944(-)